MSNGCKFAKYYYELFFLLALGFSIALFSRIEPDEQNNLIIVVIIPLRVCTSVCVF